MNLHGKRQKPTTEASEQCLTDTTRVKYYENQSLWGIEKERPTFVTEGARRMRWFHKKNDEQSKEFAQMKKENEQLKHQNNALKTQHVSNTMKDLYISYVSFRSTRLKFFWVLFPGNWANLVDFGEKILVLIQNWNTV